MTSTGEEEKRSREDEILIDQVIGAAIAVHEALGPGFVEAIYGKSLAIELSTQAIPFIEEQPIAVHYRGESVGAGRLDFLVHNRLIVELKSVESLLPIHTAQVISYLKITNLPFGLLINFNVPILKQGLRRVTHPRLYRKKNA